MEKHPYGGTSLIRKRTPLGPYRRPMPRVLGGPRGVDAFLWGRYPCMSLHIAYCGVRWMIDSGLVGSAEGGVPREQKMLKVHLPRVIYHQEN